MCKCPGDNVRPISSRICGDSCMAILRVGKTIPKNQCCDSRWKIGDKKCPFAILLTKSECGGVWVACMKGGNLYVSNYQKIT